MSKLTKEQFIQIFKDGERELLIAEKIPDDNIDIKVMKDQDGNPHVVFLKRDDDEERLNRFNSIFFGTGMRCQTRYNLYLSKNKFNGKEYTELHVDYLTLASIFLATSMTYVKDLDMELMSTMLEWLYKEPKKKQVIKFYPENEINEELDRKANEEIKLGPPEK